MIFNIQKFSLHDGPGIRTVVFFKGCPLRCGWCSNPESQGAETRVLWDKEKCARCGTCARSCQRGAVSLENGEVRIDPRRCGGSLDCVRNCPSGALSAMGERRGLQDIVDICLQDMPFYEESGGGVTLSGGEPLMQPDAAAELLDALRARGVHTAIETTGFVAPEVFARVGAKADLLLFDAKHWNGERHVEGTGANNRLILANLKRAIASGREVLVRIPVIPGYNDALLDAEGFAAALREAGATRAQLLPFHRFGERKYELLGMRYAYADAKPLRPGDLAEYIAVLRAGGVDAFF